MDEIVPTVNTLAEAEAILNERLDGALFIPRNVVESVPPETFSEFESQVLNMMRYRNMTIATAQTTRGTMVTWYPHHSHSRFDEWVHELEG